MPWTSTPRRPAAAPAAGADPELEHRARHRPAPRAARCRRRRRSRRRTSRRRRRRSGRRRSTRRSPPRPAVWRVGGALGLRRRSRPGRTGRWTGPPPTLLSRRRARPSGTPWPSGRARGDAARAPAAGAGADDDVGPPRRRLRHPEARAGHDHRAHRGLRHPVQVLGAFLEPRRRGLRPRRAARRRATPPSTSGPRWHRAPAALVLQLGSMLALVVVAAAIARLVSAWYVGHDLTTGQLLRGTLPIAWPLFASCVLVHLLEAVSILGLGVLPLAVMTWFLVTAPVIGAERVGPDRGDAPLGPPGAAGGSGTSSAPRCSASSCELLFEYAIGLLPAVRRRSSSAPRAIAWVLPAAVGVVTQLITMPFVARRHRAHLPRPAGPHGGARPRAARG